LFNLFGSSETINGLAGNGAVTSTVAGSILTVGAADRSTTFSGNIGGSLALQKTGTGTLVLSGANSHTGATTIDAGTMLVNGSLAAGSAVTVNSGATLGGSGNAAGSVTVNAGATLAPGNNGVGTLATGALTLAGTYECQLDGASADQLAVTGNLVLTGSTLAVSALGTAEAGVRVIASYTGTRAGTFGGTLPAGYGLEYDDTARQVKLTVPGGGDPYGAWASSKGLTAANNGKAQDPDSDGVPNLLEFYLAGNPLATDGSIQPRVTAMAAETVTFGFPRLDDAEASFPVQDFQIGTSLMPGSWTDVPVGAVGSNGPNGVTVAVDERGADPDWVTVVVPRALAAGGKLFGRLELSEVAP
jgi:autotransporter-associated beta strand protein